MHRVYGKYPDTLLWSLVADQGVGLGDSTGWAAADVFRLAGPGRNRGRMGVHGRACPVAPQGPSDPRGRP